MITVHWSTHDLDEYYAQIKQIPPLSKEEQQQLVALLADAERGQAMSSPVTLQAARHRLLEGHLRRAAAIAVRECPPWRCSYLLTTVRGAVHRVLVNENLIRVPDTTRQHARAHGTAERFS